MLKRTSRGSSHLGSWSKLLVIDPVSFWNLCVVCRLGWPGLQRNPGSAASKASSVVFFAWYLRGWPAAAVCLPTRLAGWASWFPGTGWTLDVIKSNPLSLLYRQGNSPRKWSLCVQKALGQGWSEKVIWEDLLHRSTCSLSSVIECLSACQVLARLCWEGSSDE